MSRAERRRGEELGRRRLLKSALALATIGATRAFGMPALAQAAGDAASPRRFVFVYFPGGWDQLLFLDPRDPEADGGRFADTNRGATMIEPGYGAFKGSAFSPRVVRAGDLTFGPAAVKSGASTAPITKHADRIAIVRGMNMGTLAHGTGYLYFLTCRFPTGNFPRGSLVATECAGYAQANEPIPVLSLGMGALNDGWPAKYSAMNVASLDDLIVALDRGKDLLEKDPVEAALAEFAKRPSSATVDLYDHDGLVSRLRDSDTAARSMLASHLVDRFRFSMADDAPSTEVRARYGLAKGDVGSPPARAAFAAQAIKQGISRCVALSIGVALDTHSVGNASHAAILHPGIAALASLIDDLASTDAPESLQKIGGRTWLDHTTILAFSEFARTPLFNPLGGRDHHLTSSCLLAGAGIAGGRVVGQSGAVAMAPCRYDLRADRVVPEGADAITPESIRATLLASAGLPWDAVGIHSPPIRALLSGSNG